MDGGWVEVSCLETEHEIVSEAKDANEKVRHHEQSTCVQLQFFEKAGKLYRVMKEMGNPFQEEIADLPTLDTRIITNSSAGEMAMSHYQTRECHFKAFI